MALERYTLGAERSRSATALVYEARTDAGDAVAVKFLSRALLEDAGARARIAADLEVATHVVHPNVERVHGGGSEDGYVWIVTELVEGASLRALVDTRAAVTSPQACRIVLDVLAGLSAAHAVGLVHRNLSPASVVIDDGGVPKITDFGLVADRTPGTAWRAIDGAAAYASPERARGEALDARSDVYAAGVLLHELLTGGAAQRSVGATVPAYLDEVVQWATSVDRDARPRSADEFAAVLQLAANRDLGADWRSRASLSEFVAASPTKVPAPPATSPVPAGAQQPAPPPLPDATRAGRLHERRRRRHTHVRVAVVAGIACAALAVSAAAFALRQGSTPSTRTPSKTTTLPGSFALGHADASGAVATTASAARNATVTSTTTKPATRAATRASTTTARTAASTATAASPAPPFDGNACALVGAADAGRVLGERVQVTPTPDAPNDCNYLASSGIIAEITVDQGLTGAPATAADFDRVVHGMSGAKQPVKGLGEDAVLVGDANAAVLFVMQRGWIVQVVAMTDTDVPNREQQLARLALTRIA